MRNVKSLGWSSAGLLCAVLATGCGGDEPDTSDGDSALPAGSGADAGAGAGADAGSGGESQFRFYVANTESESISVIDHGTMSVIDDIDLGNKPHGHAPSSRGDRIYATTDGGKGEVIAIDTADNTILWRIEVGSDLNEPHLTRDDRLLYAPDLLAMRTVVVDVEAGEQVEEIDMVDEGMPLLALHNTYASHDGRFMYVTAILSQRIARIDVSSNEIDRVYALSGDPRPAAVTEDDAKMYVQLSDLHGFIELDLESGEETARIEWPEPSELPEGYGMEGLLQTKCHGIAITPDGTQLWANTNMEGAVYVYSLPGLEQIARIEVGRFPNWIAFTGDGSHAYVTNSDFFAERGSVSVIDVESREVAATLDVGAVPKRIHRVTLPRRQ